MAQRPWPELRAKMVFPGAKDPAPWLQRAHSLGTREKTSKRTQDAEPQSERGRSPGVCLKCANCEQAMDREGHSSSGRGRSPRASGAGLGFRAAPRVLTAVHHTHLRGVRAARVARALSPGHMDFQSVSTLPDLPVRLQVLYGSPAPLRGDWQCAQGLSIIIGLYTGSPTFHLYTLVFIG